MYKVKTFFFFKLWNFSVTHPNLCHESINSKNVCMLMVLFEDACCINFSIFGDI